jgi:hypothetical protein
VSRFTVKRFVAATRVLAGLLAGAVLLFELLAANGAFHEAWHHDGKATANPCVLCLFAKGQVDSPESTPILTEFVQSSFEPAPLMESVAKADVTYLAFPSRAPPASFSLLSVVV